jgi:hypothetical protein
MTDLAARAECVAQIVSAVHGRVIGRAGKIMTVEIPADMMSSAGTLLGMSGFSATIGRQSTRLAPRRVTNAAGNVIVCDGDLVTQAYFSYDVHLAPHAAAVEPTPHAGAISITRPTPPVRG